MKRIINIKIWILAIAGCLGVQAASAQVRPPFSFNVNYSIAAPMGSLSDYSGKASFRGWQAGLQYMLNDQLGIGLKTGFQDFYERLPRAVYPTKSGDISAVQTRTFQVIPALATVQYQFTKPDAPVIPYGSLGIGAANMNYEKYWGMFVDKDNSWAFMLSPEIGVNIPFGKASPLLLNISAQYSYSPYELAEITSFNTIQGNIGLRWHID
ncbi:outer membrane beta-barrel protein [Chitinophaga japonensis]|uniref:Outer membrane protein n=1 Tax=Chitinophaga japonensis TaxID=104662 RepID=A0A562SL17_CHIJA|nr:OmpW family outer membrane protein [Chitinophaga japonensis]TWI81997.1 outer membrane protein [Chitinophaga japonensis]